MGGKNMVTVEFKMDREKLVMFNKVCGLIGIDYQTKLREMIDEEINTYWENHKKRESKNKTIFDIGVQHMIPPAY